MKLLASIHAGRDRICGSIVLAIAIPTIWRPDMELLVIAVGLLAAVVVALAFAWLPR